MKWIVQHELYGPVLLDTDTQSYTHIDYDTVKFFNRNGKQCRYFNNMKEFDESIIKVAVVPLVCTDYKPIKKRTITGFIDHNNRIMNFFNVEMINERWARNEITGASKGKCYFAILEKNQLAVNDYLLLSLLEMEKGLGY